MSIPRLAIRTSTVMALLNRTLARGNVHDSAIPPMDVLMKEQRTPFIAVYTDDCEFDAAQSRGLFASDGTINLLLEIGVSAQMPVEYQDGGRLHTILEPAKPPTDAQLEIMLDLMERQIRTALSDPDSEWGEMWRSLVAKVGNIKSQRGADSEKGIRFAGRQLLIQVSPFAEPPCGSEPRGIYAQYIQMLRDTPDVGFGELADAIEAAIRGSALSPDWLQGVTSLAMTKNESEALLLRPSSGLTGEEVITEVVQQ